MTDPFGWALLDARGLFVTFIRSEDLAKETVHTLNVGSGIPQIRPFRLTPLAEVPAWQPIETAPRDGSLISALSDVGWARREFISWDAAAEEWADQDGLWLNDGRNFTHWQPAPELPAPPKEKDA